VDGVTGIAKIAFQSDESFMPLFYFNYGYGFSSRSSKYRLGIEQNLFDYNTLKLGGAVYRETKTEDDWLCQQNENSLYSILVREDFRNYYQGEGGAFYAEQSLGSSHTFRLDYSYEQLTYLPAITDLWSILGGRRQFRTNFSTVDSSLLNQGIADYSNDEAVVKLTYTYSNVESVRGEQPKAGWEGGVQYEHSAKWLGSDFSFDRYRFELHRYQRLSNIQNINARVVYGAATGRLPLHRYFFLGGIRTLRAFDINQFYGTRVALANAEYVINVPKKAFGLAALFDFGKTGWDSGFLNDGDWKADVGIGIALGDDIRIEFTRQINGDDKSIQPSVLIGRRF
jgi:outer membrane translocation and assembly module TamA